MYTRLSSVLNHVPVRAARSYLRNGVDRSFSTKTVQPAIFRSVLFVPASNTKILSKLTSQPESIPADAVILDLEDAVAPAAKNDARAHLVEFLQARAAQPSPQDKKLVVRVNGIGTEWYEADVATVAAHAQVLAAALLPKVESPTGVQSFGEALPPSLPLWATIETPKGILCAHEIAAAAQLANLTALVAGTSDLVKDLRARHTPDRSPLLYALSKLVCAARAYNLTVLDGVHLDIKDLDSLRSICLQARDMGFDGKTAIHPSQLSIINEAFSPSEAEIDLAKRMVEAHADAEASCSGVAVVDGKLVEHLHVAEAKRILAIAALLAGNTAPAAPAEASTTASTAPIANTDASAKEVEASQAPA